MKKYELKDNLKQIYCDDVYFEFFEGSYIDPKKALKNEKDIEQVLKAKEIILNYFKSIENIVES